MSGSPPAPADRRRTPSPAPGPRRRPAAALASWLLLATASAGCSPVDLGSAEPASVDGLTIAAEHDDAGYARDRFGQRWKDVDGNGCGQRDDVLGRDLDDVRRRSRCVVVSGVLHDPYTGQQVEFRKAAATAVDIDHVVALAEAWRSGAARWDDTEREEFANDLDVLRASAAGVNRSKGDADAAGWMPHGTVRACRYARLVVQIKVRYRLTADPAEVAVLRRALDRCPDPTPSAS